MKTILYILKLINDYTNNRPTAEEEARQILKFMLYSNDTVRVLEVKKQFDIQCKNLMVQERAKAIDIAIEINKVYGLETI